MKVYNIATIYTDRFNNKGIYSSLIRTIVIEKESLLLEAIKNDSHNNSTDYSLIVNENTKYVNIITNTLNESNIDRIDTMGLMDTFKYIKDHCPNGNTVLRLSSSYTNNILLTKKQIVNNKDLWVQFGEENYKWYINYNITNNNDIDMKECVKHCEEKIYHIKQTKEEMNLHIEIFDLNNNYLIKAINEKRLKISRNSIIHYIQNDIIPKFEANDNFIIARVQVDNYKPFLVK